MTDPIDRLPAVARLGRQLTARAAELEEAALAALAFPRRIIRADIALTARRLAAFEQLIPRLRDRRPAGTAAFLFPGNAILSNPVTAVAAAFLAGNQVVMRFPRRRKAWADLVGELLRAAFGSAVAACAQPGPVFVGTTLADPAVEVLMVFGSDDWMLPYEDEVRRSGTKLIFEGPGKDPFLVLEGADVVAAARAAATSATYNAGQACTAPERFYVAAPLHEEFVGHLLAAVGAVPTGDPADEATWVGPLAPADAARVRTRVTEAVSTGARVLSGGTVDPAGLVAPTVLTGVDNRMPLMRLETFGPVLPVMAVDSAEQAVALAEDSPYGLSATVYGGAAWVADRLARSHGEVYRNETWLHRRSRVPLAPYGGRRRSGWVWEWNADQFVRRDGPRSYVTELSLPCP